MQSAGTEALASEVVLEPVAPPAKADYRVTVACVYQDEGVRKWAQEVWMRVPASAGAAILRVREWKLSDLSQPQVLAEAVVEAAKADVVVVCMDACERSPGNLFAWVVAWLPRRPRDTGALVAVVCQSEQVGGQSRRAQEYLGSVASARGMEFILEECTAPTVSRDLSEKKATAAGVCARGAAVAAVAAPAGGGSGGIGISVSGPKGVRCRRPDNR